MVYMVYGMIIDDYRIFCGDLGNEVNDAQLGKAFSKFTSFQRAKVIRDKVMISCES